MTNRQLKVRMTVEPEHIGALPGTYAIGDVLDVAQDSRGYHIIDHDRQYHLLLVIVEEWFDEVEMCPVTGSECTIPKTGSCECDEPARD